MSENQNNNECNLVCWVVAAAAGIVAMILLAVMADFGLMQALFTGGLLGVILGLVLMFALCRRANPPLGASTTAPSAATSSNPSTTTSQSAASAPEAAAEVPQPAAEAAPAAAQNAAMTTAAPLMSSDVKPSAPLAGEAELANRKGDWKYEAPAAEKPKAKAKAKKAAPKAAAEKPAKAAAKKPAKSAPKRAAVAADGKPLTYDAAPAEGADDLKLISGVGPKLETTLNDMGIYRFEQVAGWRKKEIAWVDDRLRFKGRIERDDWMSQAKILAKGGETEFSKRSKK